MWYLQILVAPSLEFSWEIFYCACKEYHPRRPRSSQSGLEKRRDESFQARVEEPLGTDSHARAWKLLSRLFSRPEWLPLGLRGWRSSRTTFKTTLSRCLHILWEKLWSIPALFLRLVKDWYQSFSWAGLSTSIHTPSIFLLSHFSIKLSKILIFTAEYSFIRRKWTLDYNAPSPRGGNLQVGQGIRKNTAS